MYLRRPCKSFHGVISPQIPLNHSNLWFAEEKLRKSLMLVSSLTYLNAESLLPDINRLTSPFSDVMPQLQSDLKLIGYNYMTARGDLA